jgi:hypothetical protein
MSADQVDSGTLWQKNTVTENVSACISEVSYQHGSATDGRDHRH